MVPGSRGWPALRVPLPPPLRDRGVFGGGRMAGARIALSGVGPEADRLRWESASRLRVGRASSSDIVLNDASVSREHAEIRFTAQGWVLRDLGSSNRSEEHTS